MTNLFPSGMNWHQTPRATRITFWKAPGRPPQEGIWVRGGTDAELAEFVATSTLPEPIKPELK